MKNFLIALAVLILIAAGSFYFIFNRDAKDPSELEVSVVDTAEVETETPPPPFQVLPEGEGEDEVEPVETIGSSVDGEAIMAYHFGEGDKEVLFIGGVHSAFAPNTTAVAEEIIDALEAGTIEVPAGVMVTVIPNLNPDATGSANTLAARLNANEVDLNRNFDCEWDTEGVWRSQAVSGGSAAFSEPEAAALRDYVNGRDISAAVVYYAAGGGVYASNCKAGVLADTSTLTSLYADASGYSANKEFDYYAITGDLVNWLAKSNIPAISVLLSNYQATEWSKNQAGVEAVLEFVANN